ncbi:hypothetical protein U9M48_034006 [Paspalum notatum var. saurae]|uniref:Uncharacterized protein n=1 Tax=Paspalum notatum var. saurae TaxID=547442 RepID=A0AAQ3U9N8_PASNO
MAFVGSGLPVLPVVDWDGHAIGDGQVGPIMLALSDLLWEDMKWDNRGREGERRGPVTRWHARLTCHVNKKWPRGLPRQQK